MNMQEIQDVPRKIDFDIYNAFFDC